MTNQNIMNPGRARRITNVGKWMGNPSQRVHSGALLILLMIGVVFQAPAQSKPLDPSLNRYLAPSIKHAFGLRMVSSDIWNLYSNRLGREPRFIVTFADKSDWNSFQKSVASKLKRWKDIKETYIFTCHFVMAKPLPNNEIPEALRQKYKKDPASLEAASEGMYDQQYIALGKTLNQYSQSQLDRLVLRPGHEMNGNWYPHSTNPKKASPEKIAKSPGWYKATWQRMHRLVTKELNGKRVLWDFCPSGGVMKSSVTPPSIGDAYPGDEYVDIIGIDRYAGKADDGDVGKGTWEEAESNCFAWTSRFAAEHGKMTAVDETNLIYTVRNGKQTGSDDYPKWFEGLAKWGQQEVAAHRLHHLCLFETDTKTRYHACLYRDKTIPGRERQALNFPKSAAKIIELFGGRLPST